MHEKEFVEYIVRALVENPDDVRVERKTDDLGVLIELTVHPDDMGKIIGKEGRTAKSIRTLLRVLGAKSDERVNMKIIEPGGGREVPLGDGEEVAEMPEAVEETTPEPDVPRLSRDPDLDEKNPLDEIHI
jgi:uncharacterized protein